MVRVSKAKLWKAIRNHCLECMGGSYQEVENCTSPKCSLYLFRYGKAPTAIQEAFNSQTGDQNNS